MIKHLLFLLLGKLFIFHSLIYSSNTYNLTYVKLHLGFLTNTKSCIAKIVKSTTLQCNCMNRKQDSYARVYVYCLTGSKQKIKYQYSNTVAIDNNEKYR